ncbi:hypothetical protein C8R46DRAFT_1215900 [Mycena filopes]|nr:hypothetical protein C8R46DRAFT_1215900 [Mycena filopes]
MPAQLLSWSEPEASSASLGDVHATINDLPPVAASLNKHKREESEEPRRVKANQTACELSSSASVEWAFCPQCCKRLANLRARDRHMDTVGCGTLALRRERIAERRTSEELTALKISVHGDRCLNLQSLSEAYEVAKPRRRRDRAAPVARPSAPISSVVEFSGVPSNATVAVMHHATQLELHYALQRMVAAMPTQPQTSLPLQQVSTSSFSGVGSSHETPIASGSGVASYNAQTLFSGAWPASDMQGTGQYLGDHYYQQASPELDALALQASFAQAQWEYALQPGAARTGAPYQNFYPSPIQCLPVAPGPFPYPSTAASSSHNHATHPGSSQIESQAKPHVPFFMEVPPKLVGKYKPRGRAMNACGSDIPPGPAYYPQAPVQIESSWDVLVPGVAGPTSLGTPSKPKRIRKKKPLTKLHEEGAASSSLTAPVEEAEASAERSQAVAPLELVNEASSAAETFDAMHGENDQEQLSPVGTTPVYSTDDSGSSAEQSPQYPATPSDEFGEMFAAGSKSEADACFEAFLRNIESATYVPSGLDAAFAASVGSQLGMEWNGGFQPDPTSWDGEVPIEDPTYGL